jgi:hypothetical protein
VHRVSLLVFKRNGQFADYPKPSSRLRHPAFFDVTAFPAFADLSPPRVCVK